MTLEWKKEAPSAPGTWIRINAAGKPQIYEVFETQGDTLSLEAGLWLTWGSGGAGSSRLVHPGPDQARFLWFGPLPPHEEDL